MEKERERERSSYATTISGLRLRRSGKEIRERDARTALVVVLCNCARVCIERARSADDGLRDDGFFPMLPGRRARSSGSMSVLIDSAYVFSPSVLEIANKNPKWF